LRVRVGGGGQRCVFGLHGCCGTSADFHLGATVCVEESALDELNKDAKEVQGSRVLRKSHRVRVFLSELIKGNLNLFFCDFVPLQSITIVLA
jgi:hypothetical protein